MSDWHQVFGILRLGHRHNNLRLAYLSKELARLGFQTFLPPPHVQRVYFEFLVRCPDELQISVETLIEALTAEGCEVSYPRYPLLHQQPLFTEGLYAELGAFAGRKDVELPRYLPNALPITEKANSTFIRLPSFPLAEYPLLQQYVLAFQKVLGHVDRIKSESGRGRVKTQTVVG